MQFSYTGETSPFYWEREVFWVDVPTKAKVILRSLYIYIYMHLFISGSSAVIAYANICYWMAKNGITVSYVENLWVKRVQNTCNTIIRWFHNIMIVQSICKHAMDNAVYTKAPYNVHISQESILQYTNRTPFKSSNSATEIKHITSPMPALVV